MPKKVTKKLNIPVPAKKMGFWVNKENLRKGERTIKTKKDKALVLRNRSGYEYSKIFTGYELDKDNLELQFAARRRVNPQAAARDLRIRAQDTRTAPILTAKQFFDFTKRDVEGIDTPPKLEKTYDHDTMSAFVKRVSYIAADMNVEPKAILFKDMKGKKWGEATSTNSVRFDPELLEKSKDFQDKVIIHELLHLRYPGHPVMHKQMEKTYIQRYKDMEKPSSPKHVSKISDDLSIQELIDIARKDESELARLGMKLTPEQRTFDPTYQHIKKEIAEAKVQISKKQFARLDARKQAEKPKQYYIIDGTGQILHKSTSKEGAEKWFNKFKPTNITYKEKRWEVITKEKYEQMDFKPKQETKKPTDLNTIENIDQAKKHLKTLLSIAEIDEYEDLRKDINKAEGVPETSVERTKAIRDLLKTEFENRYNKKAKFSVKKGTGTVGSWTFITGSKDEYGHFTKEETEFIEDILKGESIQGTNDIGLDYERAENHLRRITREKLKKTLAPETKPKEKIDRSKSIAAGKNLYQEKYSPGRTHLAKTKTMTDMQKRRLIKACIDNEVDTRELDPSLKYDENQEIIQDMIEADDSQYRDESSKIDKKIAKLETVYYDDFGKERIKEREIDGKTTEEKVITKKDLSKNRKKTQLDQWKKEPYKSKIDVEEIDTGPKEKKFVKKIKPKKETEETTKVKIPTWLLTKKGIGFDKQHINKDKELTKTATFRVLKEHKRTDKAILVDIIVDEDIEIDFLREGLTHKKVWLPLGVVKETKETVPKPNKKTISINTEINSNVKEIVNKLNKIEHDYEKAKIYRPDNDLNYIDTKYGINNIKVEGKPFSKEQLTQLKKEEKIIYVDKWMVDELGGYVAGTGWYLTQAGLENAKSLGLTIRDKEYYSQQTKRLNALARKKDKDRIKGDLIEDIVWKNGEWLNSDEKVNIKNLTKIGNITTKGMSTGGGATIYKDGKEEYIYLVGYNDNKKKVKYTKNLEKLIKEEK